LSAVFTSSSNDYSGSTGTAWLTVLPPQATPTTTTLSVSPPSPQQFGTNETLTATISPSAAPGSVQFEDNGNNIGSPVTVSGGTAQIQTSSEPVGTDNLSAVFTPSSGDYSGSTGTASLTLYAPLSITTTSLPKAKIGKAYSATLTATGGNGPYTWSLAVGSSKLPKGLKLSSAGAFSGKPKKAGTFHFTVEVQAGSSSATQALSIKVK
jgi:Bacterial Ig-like domain (group 3)